MSQRTITPPILRKSAQVHRYSDLIEALMRKIRSVQTRFCKNKSRESVQRTIKMANEKLQNFSTLDYFESTITKLHDYKLIKRFVYYL